MNAAQEGICCHSVERKKKIKNLKKTKKKGWVGGGVGGGVGVGINENFVLTFQNSY